MRIFTVNKKAFGINRIPGLGIVIGGWETAVSGWTLAKRLAVEQLLFSALLQVSHLKLLTFLPILLLLLLTILPLLQPRLDAAKGLLPARLPVE